MKIAITSAIVVLSIAVGFLSFEFIKLENGFSAQIKKKVEECNEKIVKERIKLSGEFQERYKGDMEKFSETVKKAKEEMAKNRELEGKRKGLSKK